MTGKFSAINSVTPQLVATVTLTVETGGAGFNDITAEATRFIERIGAGEGALLLYLRHTSASLVIQENADPDVRADLDRFFARLVPDGDPLFEHTCEGPDDMPAHVRTALTTVNLSIPFHDGRLALGTWQGVYLWEHRRQGGARKLVVHLGE